MDDSRQSLTSMSADHLDRYRRRSTAINGQPADWSLWCDDDFMVWKGPDDTDPTDNTRNMRDSKSNPQLRSEPLVKSGYLT